MARAGMTRWRGKATAGTEGGGGDDVQKSLELLDKVLSEFDDIENGNLTTGPDEDGKDASVPGATATTASSSTATDGGGGKSGVAMGATGRSESSETTTGNVSSTPDDDSPSLGHQSEDDGYMSMNGRRAKFVLSFRPVPDEAGSTLPPVPDPPPDPPPEDSSSSSSSARDYPPPPEEAERIISNLLPKVSPVNSGKRASPAGSNHVRRGKGYQASMTLEQPRPQDENTTTATQTTLPKTRHQRPYGWENGTGHVPFRLQDPPQPTYRFGSLPYEGAYQSGRSSSPWLQKSGPLPPRTVPAAVDRHREVRRSNSGDVESPRRIPPPYDEDPSNFSDDSLEESLPPPPVSKRGSIAWEVPLGFDDEDPLLTPGSTKVIGRRRRRSTENSSNSSIHRLREVEDWPDPPPSDEPVSPFSDSIYDSNDDYGLPSTLPLDLTFNGTYVIRKGRKKERSPVKKNSSFEMINAKPSLAPPVTYDMGKPRDSLKRASSTFDNIKLLLRDGLIEGINDAPPDFPPPNPPTGLVRVVSLPTLPTEDVDPATSTCDVHHRNSKCDRYSKLNELSVTLEEAEDELSSLDNPSLNDDVRKTVGNQCNGVVEDKKLQTERPVRCNEVETQTDLSDMECQNELEIVGKQIREISKTKSELDEVEKKIQEIVKIKTVMEREEEAEAAAAAGDPWVRASDVGEDKPPDEFRVNVEVLQHEFGPLPPSPVDEDDEEYSEIFRPRGKADTLPEPFYKCHEPPGSDPSGKYLNRPPEPPPHRASDPITNSLKTRSMDAGFARGGPRAYCNGSRRESGPERRTLPSEFPGAVSRRRTFHKRSSTSPQDSMQTSCSLPETPIFARGCDIPRTPHRRGPGMQATGTGTGTSTTGGTYRRNGTGTGTGVSLSGGLNQAMVGAELLRMAGGPGRGWYPRHRQQHRPASIEHLDRLTQAGNGLPGPWDMGTGRKPMTLPPNITPKFFHRSPREALRRVTSLLIRGKGSSGTRESKKDIPTMPSMRFGDASVVGAAGSEQATRQKKGFFKNFWKRSRHYSLDHQ